MVIHEVLRLANIAAVVFRQAKQDVNIEGYSIPEGSKIMICPSVAHLNPKVYEDPTVFNPWSWKDTPEPVGGSKDFMAFGGGLRLCVGADFAKMQMAIFLHCLVTKYRVEMPELEMPEAQERREVIHGGGFAHEAMAESARSEVLPLGAGEAVEQGAERGGKPS
ncbi:hypothetical protein ACP4OV_008632 [Aristida adscensionis]